MLTDTKKLREHLKKLRIEKGYSLDDMERETEANGEPVSKTTLSRFFGDSAEDTEFRFETTIRPICNVLLDIDEDEDDDKDDILAMKSFIRLKKDIISALKAETEQTKINYAQKLQEETEKFQRSLDFVKNQILLKDQRIDALMTMNNDLMNTNNKLINQLMDCPIRKEC